MPDNPTTSRARVEAALEAIEGQNETLAAIITTTAVSPAAR